MRLLLTIWLGWVLTATAEPRTGDFSLSFKASELFTPEKLAGYGHAVEGDDEITWEVYVPPGTDFNKPPGVLTYISPTPSGRLTEAWKPLLAEKNLIWIGANRSGNLQRTPPRVVYAILGTELIRSQYPVDETRLYLSGFSGGGRVASWTMTQYSKIYRGAIYFCGVNYYDLAPETYALMEPNRYVFMTGTDDFNLRDTRNVYQRYRKAGFPHLLYMNVPDMGHRLPSVNRLEVALDYLDGVPVPD